MLGLDWVTGLEIGCWGTAWLGGGLGGFSWFDGGLGWFDGGLRGFGFEFGFGWFGGLGGFGDWLFSSFFSKFKTEGSETINFGVLFLSELFVLALTETAGATGTFVTFVTFVTFGTA